MVTPKRKKGRPTLRTPELVETILMAVASGEALAVVCRSAGMPDVLTFLRWTREDDELREQYEIAQEARAEEHEAYMARLAKKLQGRPSKAKVLAIRAEFEIQRWRMSKMNPKRYGDRVDHRVEQVIDIGGELERRRLSLEQRRAAVLDGGALTPLPALPAPVPTMEAAE